MLIQLTTRMAKCSQRSLLGSFRYLGNASSINSTSVRTLSTHVTTQPISMVKSCAKTMKWSAHCSCHVRSFHASSVTAGKVVPFLLADIGEGITECDLIQWFVKPGDKVEQFTRICEVQSDKAAVDISSRFDGVIKTLHYKVGDIALVGKPLVDIELNESDENNVESSPEPIARVEPSTVHVPSTAAPPTHSDDVVTYATPAVRRVAKEHNVDLKLVAGSGPAGRILKGDVLAYIAGEQTGEQAVSETASQTVAAPTKTEIVALTPIQKAMFKTMTKSLQIPHFGFSDEIELNAISAFRASLNDHVKTLPVGTYPFKKVSYMPIFLKALSTALAEYPILNACIIDADVPGQVKLQYRASHNIGIAMDTPQGLIVPNVKNVQNKSILEIAADLERLKEAGKKGSIALSDLQGGTITLSNIGNIGGTLLHPVLVTSEVCIGAIGKVQRLPRFETQIDSVTGQSVERVVAKEILNVSFNADHRVIDGATMGRFVQLWKTYLENPSILTARLQ
ncbi:hypothetical protein BATDEDRAFT_34723 [Batrachochytrium dendrobatidis JAM81]|uniref:Dihydrolipoamide acetyltransferase component of pyruvate dehydrogenase complex n=2 Tax=Batrachochytrium dendrobatidis TaxID=109871 RepID=F4P0A5_BATDJ|nr:uncharacterized protein BATDEDRAFT_34723 [Batrachochytrium dendrobatidis JAM81]EGF81106.1 hypothetical protein BATDEDRAFT_34723 [Batrachochytrium dendrobatidis JAM81]KAJ8329901.1 hypothetical protein O5D80_002091 [Batrachochytrium dendrobatidis]KAK5669967.1 hypothetical protein QVD99_004339 [Batrachochytrium dendrobatidis]OAJ38538.1 hypothetical protein BDEG_22449 [Batrachochytrium dendrobatidis JEL423]|eukprot:XP_006677988.1 hypothetical protein BATDEDRAFT_34723 [Batrachochytrium dendrobatidis JAM81]